MSVKSIFLGVAIGAVVGGGGGFVLGLALFPFLFPPPEVTRL